MKSLGACSRRIRYDERYQERYSYSLQRNVPEREEVAAQGEEAKSDVDVGGSPSDRVIDLGSGAGGWGG